MPATRAIEGHHDFAVLEARLAGLIRETKASGGPFAPVAVIAPTRRLLDHLRLTLAGTFPGLLNVFFFHHDSLAREAAGSAGAVLPRPLADGVKERVLAGTIEALGGELAAYAASRPGMLTSLRRTLDDLREAEIEPGRAQETPGLSRQGRETLRVYAAYASRLAELASHGLADRAGLLSAALPHVKVFARRFQLVIHYGAYELIGSNLALMRAVESSGARLVYLTPFHASAPAFDYARRFWLETFGAGPSDIPGGGETRLLASRLPLLYDEAGRPDAPLDPPPGLFHAQGAAAELREVALRILRDHRDLGLPLGEIAVIARSLEPYSADLPSVFAEHGLPFVTTASRPAPGEARVQAVLRLARAVLGDFERQPLLDLCRSGLLRERGRDPAREAHGWDLLSREWGVMRGQEAWARDLPRFIEDWQPHVEADADDEARERARRLKERRGRLARSLADQVEDLHSASAPLAAASGWAAWADAMERLQLELLAGAEEGDAAARTIGGVLAEMRDLEAAGVPFETPSSALVFFERALAAATVPVGSPLVPAAPGSADNGGVRVLDAMQARGLAFDAVYLIGLNGDLFPRRPREDPFLSDEDRRLLRRTSSAPLPIASSSPDEEHLLLAHLLGSARRRLTISWQRADDEGRARVPSLALREVARLAFGAADLRAAISRSVRIETHPGEAGRDGVRRLGLISDGDACLSAALGARSPRLLIEELRHLPLPEDAALREVLAAGLRMLDLIEDPESGDLEYDARVGEAAPLPSHWSPSRLEALGLCPQNYFFRHVLRVDELEEALEGYALDAAEIGGVVHEVLYDTYRALDDAGLLHLPGADPRTVAEEAGRVAAESWERRARGLRGRMRPRYPLLWETTTALWLDALRRFLDEDVAALVAGRARILGTEDEARASLTLAPSGRTIELHGRFDRVTRAGSGEIVVSDYKSSGDLAAHVELRDILKGSRLQIPLYVLLAESRLEAWGARGSAVRAEVLGVGPSFAREERRRELDAPRFQALRSGFVETLSVLVDLAAAGHFPLESESRVCPYCPYVRACRRTHPATLERLASAPEGGAYALLKEKNTRRPTLGEIRRGTGDGAGG